MANIKINSKFKGLFTPHRYKVYYGGRGGGKSWAVAEVLLILGCQKKMRILCTRDIQKSIKDSVHKLLSDWVTRLKLGRFYRITREGIYGLNGTEFLFHGLKLNPQAIKSLEGIDICWVEEAQNISNESWEVLIPTIRKDNSEIWMTLNPNLSTDPTFTRFIKEPRRLNQHTIKVNYYDNIFFSDSLRAEMEYQREIDYNDYLHIWEGECKTSTEAQIFKGKYKVHDFEAPPNTHFNYGLDWGFSQDPLAMVRIWVKDRELYIDYEAGGIGIELNDTYKVIDSIPGMKNARILADNARPESISLVRHQKYDIKAVFKWPGSVQDGIEFIRSFRTIHIHTRCLKVAEEFLLYSFKTDRLTGDVLSTIIDTNNHYIDSIRYALQPRIKQRGDTKVTKLIGF